MVDARLLEPNTTRGLKRVEYDQLVAMGAFENERVELLEGVIVTMSPNYPEHANPVQLLTELLVPALVGLANVRITSVSKDRNIKAPLYAASGFREYALVNVPERVVEVFREPGPTEYRSRTRHAVGESISLLDFPDVRLEIACLF